MIRTMHYTPSNVGTFLVLLSLVGLSVTHAKDESVGSARSSGSPWPMRGGDPKRLSYVSGGKEFEQFTTTIGHEDNCGATNTQSPLVSALALSGATGVVIGTTGAHIVAVDAEGGILWTYPKSDTQSSPDPGTNGTSNPVPITKSTPCAFYNGAAIGINGTTFVSYPSAQAPVTGSDDAGVVALNTEDGSLKWNITLPAGTNTGSNYSRACTPVVLSPGGLIGYLSCLNSTNIVVYAFNPLDGSLRLQHALPLPAALVQSAVTDLAPSTHHPSTLYLATAQKFYSCAPSTDPNPNAPFDVSCWDTPHGASQPVRLAESRSGSPYLWTNAGGGKGGNAIIALDLQAKKVSNTLTFPNNATRNFGGCLVAYADEVYTVVNGVLTAYSPTLNTTLWTGARVVAADVETGLAVGPTWVYVVTPHGITPISHLTKTKGEVGKVIPLSANAGPSLNPNTGIVVSGAGHGTVFISTATSIKTYSLLEPTVDSNGGPETLGGGTIALIVIFSVLLGVVLFSFVWYFHNRAERDRVPLI